MAKIKVSCVHCKAEVERYRSQIHGTVYCSRECRSSHFRENNTVAVNCHFCGSEKRVGKSQYNHNNKNGRIFCSKECKDTWQRDGLIGENNPFYGKQHTDETKRKVSDTKKSANLTGVRAHNYNTFTVACEECGQETRKIKYLIDRSRFHFCSVTCNGKWKSRNNVGESNPNWNPELTEEERVRGRKYEEYYAFLKDVLTRDDCTCQVCGYYSKWGKGMNVHHLNSYDWDKENRTNPNNGITLCKACHKDFHMEYGYGKNTADQFAEYIRSLAS